MISNEVGLKILFLWIVSVLYLVSELCVGC
jgi:hypothetical protein